MLFLSFETQKERRKYGGSAFIEIQFCRLPAKTEAKDIVAVNRVKNWQNNSLYIYFNNVTVLFQEYSQFFDCGFYNNLKSGVVDIYGINYYAPSFIDPLIEKLHQEKPIDYEPLVEWLKKAKQYNGFYILGL